MVDIMYQKATFALKLAVACSKTQHANDIMEGFS
jgi:hypothetical protein